MTLTESENKNMTYFLQYFWMEISYNGSLPVLRGWNFPSKYPKNKYNLHVAIKISVLSKLYHEKIIKLNIKGLVLMPKH